MTEEPKVLASEASHWYRKNGEPCYEVEGAKGQMRPTTLRDARKLDLLPSVTLILKCAASPGLEAWKSKQLLESALTLPKLLSETLDDYAMRVIEDSRAQSLKARNRGTELHAAIEDYIRGQSSLLWQEHLDKLKDTLAQYGIEILKGNPEHSFASPLGYGGKIDWHDETILIDFKTKERISDEKKLAWPEQCWQLAAYAKGLSRHRTINVFVGIEDREVRIHEWTQEDADWGWECFEALLTFWKRKTKF